VAVLSSTSLVPSRSLLPCSFCPPSLLGDLGLKRVVAYQVQEEMVNEMWSDDALRLAPCQRQHGPNNEVQQLNLLCSVFHATAANALRLSIACPHNYGSYHPPHHHNGSISFVWGSVHKHYPSSHQNGYHNAYILTMTLIWSNLSGDLAWYLRKQAWLADCCFMSHIQRSFPVNAAVQVLFLGPRVKMGIYEGRPNRICPHTTTGRVDYFGPFVNRCPPHPPPPPNTHFQHLLHSRPSTCQPGVP